MRSLLVAAVALTAAGSHGCHGRPPAALTLRSVVLYQNGIGYFEHRGTAKSGRVDLAFRRHEMGDVLKTITIIPVGNAAASAVAALTTHLVDTAAADDPAERVSLSVALTDPAAELSIAYAVPTASWQPSYRVVLPDTGSDQALLQGWAAINNTSDSDWRNISLTLATGAPLSFAIDLMTPRFVARPDVSGAMVEPVTTGAVSASRASPGDRDSDRIADVDDLCPNQPEDIDGFEDADGCPDPDNDQDRILDASDMCPSDPETYNGIDDEDGCPDRGRVVVVDTKIEILDKIYFKHQSADIRPESLPIIEAIAATLLGNPEIRNIAIQGHAAANETDPWGISRDRAAAVKRALTDRGVTTTLTVESYGASQPIRPGKDESANEHNRRAEFLILERGDDGGTETQAPPSAAPGVTGKNLRQSVSAGVAAHDVAGSVRYRLAAPVTIERGASALVPIINQEITGEDVFLFRPDSNAPASATHPFRAAYIENQTDLELQPGPVAIFAKGAFVGEGLIDRLHARETALIPYALDSSCSVAVTQEYDRRPVRLASAARGVLAVEDKEVIKTRYEIRVGANAPARIVVEHPRTSGYEAETLPPKTQDTSSLYLAPLPIQAGKRSVLELEELRPVRRTIRVVDASAQELAAYAAAGQIPPAAAAALGQVMALRDQLAAVDREARDLRHRIADAGTRADELRASLQAIGKDAKAAALRSQLLANLTQATEQGEALARELAAKGATRAEVNARLTEAIRALDFEPSASAP